MALTNEEWTEIGTITDRLRAMGLAVCIFTPDDVQSAREGDEDGAAMSDEDGAAMSDEDAKTWIDRERKHLEEAMSTAGNQYISDNLD